MPPLSFFAGLALTVFATHANPNPELRFELDPGGHSGLITGLHFEDSGTRIYSASLDRTIRVWDLSSGRTEDIVRPFIGANGQGAINSFDVLNQQKLVAIPGYADTTGYQLRIFDIANRVFKTSLFTDRERQEGSQIRAARISADGTHIAAGDRSGNFVVWDAESYQELLRKDINDTVHDVEFANRGSTALVVSSKTLFEFDLSRPQEAPKLLNFEARIRDLVVGKKFFAFGDQDGCIYLGTTRPLAIAAKLGCQKLPIGSLALSPDQKMLVATCGSGRCRGHPQVVWSLEAHQELKELWGFDNAVDASVFSSDGRLFAAAGGLGREIRIWRTDTWEPIQTLSGIGRRFSGLAVSLDGRTIAFGSEDPCPEMRNCPNGPDAILTHKIELPSQNRMSAVPSTINLDDADYLENFTGTVHKVGSITAIATDEIEKELFNVLQISLDGEVKNRIERKGQSDGRQHISFSISPDGQSVVSGGNNGYLAMYDTLSGQTFEFERRHKGIVSAVAIDKSGKLLVSGSGDRTMRLWSLKTKKLIASFFYEDPERWAIWTPDGYFDASHSLSKVIGWHRNRGEQELADYITGQQVFRRFQNAELVRDRIVNLDGSPTNSMEALASVFDSPPPRIRDVEIERRVLGRNANLRFHLDHHQDSTVDVYVDQHRVETLEGQPFHLLGIPVRKGTNQVLIVARNEFGSHDKEVLFESQIKGNLDKKKTLYVVGIGVNLYPQVPPELCPKQDCNLDFAVRDAAYFVNNVAAAGRADGRFSTVIPTLAVNTQVLENNSYPVPQGADVVEANKSNIVDIMDSLVRAQDQDTTIVFLSGHGAAIEPYVSDGGYRAKQVKEQYYFLSTNAEPNRFGAGWKTDTVYPWNEFLAALTKEGVEGNLLVFIDTCHAGAFRHQQSITEIIDRGIQVFAAVGKQSNAFESTMENDDGHGLFTSVLLEGVNGNADGYVGNKGKDGVTDLNELDNYLFLEVSTRSKSRMVPQNELDPSHRLIPFIQHRKAELDH